jgi:hypothetical protein
MVGIEQLTGAGWILLGISAVVAAGVIWLTARAPGDHRLGEWADRYGLDLTEANRPVVARYLRRTRSLRAIGAAAGWLASPVYVAMTDQPFPLGGNGLALAIGGYLLGAVIAEATFLRPSSGSTVARSASLVPRALSDYVPSLTVWALRILPLVTVAFAVLYALVSKEPGRSAEPSITFVYVVSGLLIAFAVVIEAILRAIVRRPQPATREDLVAADDAIRASSIHALSGAAIGMLLVGAGWAAFSVGIATSIRPLRWTLPWLGVIAFGAAVGSWIDMGHPRTWRVRHDVKVGGPR